ncbi:MAG: PAS domain-containing protein [Acidobacteria bacterium]|nr:PAS domain-containing protein [Acidobacteriota bacterium]MBV9479161.1 PAS domain-containing protein [Acidobacteriota bacterium]
MRRKTKIVLGITLMVFILVASFSYIYISELLRQRVTSAYETASLLAQQLAYAAYNAQPDLSSTRIDTDDPKAVRSAVAEALAEDVNLNNMMESVVSNWPIIYDAAIVDMQGRVLLHANPELVEKLIPARPDFAFVRDARFRRQLKIVYSPAAVYEVHSDLMLNGAPFGSVRVGVSTVFLKNEVTPRLRHAVIFSSIALLLSLILAAGLSHLALGPLERISKSLDTVAAGDAHFVPDEEAAYDEYGLVTLKIAHLGRQMRDTKEIFSALKDNVDQIMANLQDGLMLFTRDFRVVLVSASVEQFLGRPRGELLGRTVHEIFSDATDLGALVLTAFDRRWPIAQRDVESNNKNVQVSLDFIQERGTQIGALLTMRDTESVRRIEDEIETSRRLSASSRITRGVAHEVKNPINAIVLHLQLLEQKLEKVDPDSKRHMDIIGSEIHRLDRVVQILVDFTRQRDLHMEETDLRRLVAEVALLASPDAEVHGVRIAREMPEEPLLAKVDEDFMKQALLNIVINGEQAMPQGGCLTIRARREEATAVIEVCDQGSGIPKDVQDKIFELYFTTKKGGSGIGLAQTYQIMQWHYGSVEFETAEGQGTTFRLRLPLLEAAAEGAPKESEVTTRR